MRSLEEGARMPVLCIPHGGGPLPLLRNPTHSSLTNWLRTAAQGLPTPLSILIISAHWEVFVTVGGRNDRPCNVHVADKLKLRVLCGTGKAAHSHK